MIYNRTKKQLDDDLNPSVLKVAIRDLYDGYLFTSTVDERCWEIVRLMFANLSDCINFPSHYNSLQIAGAYPGVDTDTYLSISSEPAAELGQWNYDFSDPTGPQMGTVALPGMTCTYETEDPVVLISDHIELGVTLPKELVDPVDLVVVCDRARRHFAERKFLVMELEDSPGEITIAAFVSKGEMPPNAKILGHVTLVQIPWLPSMQKKKSGFMEEDELF